MRKLQQATRVLTMAALLLSGFAGYGQDFVNFTGIWNSPGPLVGSFTGGGTATITLTGGGGISNPSMNLFNPAPYIANYNATAAGGATGFQSFAAINNSYWVGYKNITFTFSTPVFINDLYIADIDRGDASNTSHDDRFNFTGVTFGSVSSSYGGATLTGSGIPPIQLPGSANPVTSGTTDNLEYARWQNSTAAVTSFTVTFAPTAPGYTGLPNEVMNSVGYMQFALKVTPATSLSVLFGATAARIKDGQLMVDFASEHEINNSHFEIEASADGETFTKMGTVASKAINGNSFTQLDYSFTTGLSGDALFLGAGVLLIGFTALTANRKNRRLSSAALVAVALLTLAACNKKGDTIAASNKSLFIRIVQVDKDGTKSYSKTIKVVHE